MKKMLAFVEPYYRDKDIMHNMWHIELVKKMVDHILSIGNYVVDEECLFLATYFHGFIYRDEDTIKEWMKEQKYDDKMIAKHGNPKEVKFLKRWKERFYMTPMF